MQYRSEDEGESPQNGNVSQTRLPRGGNVPPRGRSVLDKYRCEAVSVTGFVQRLVDYLRHGYWFYVTGEVPAGKDPREVDEKLIEKYRIAVSEHFRLPSDTAYDTRREAETFRCGLLSNVGAFMGRQHAVDASSDASPCESRL